MSYNCCLIVALSFGLNVGFDVAFRIPSRVAEIFVGFILVL